MDIISIINVLSNVQTDKIVILFCLTFSSGFAYYVLKNNTKAMNGLNATLQIIVSNQSLHDERNKSDFKAVNIAVDNVKDDVSRVEKDVESVRTSVNDINARMATKDELQHVSQTVSIIQGKITK